MKRVELTFHTLASQYAHANVPDEVFAGGFGAIRDWLTHNYSEVHVDETEVDPISREDCGWADIWIDCAEGI